VRTIVNGLTGAVVALLLSVHSVAVIAQRLASRLPKWQPGEPHAALFGVPWDFNFYGLILFGLLGVACGIRCILSATGMKRGRPGAARQGLRAYISMLLLFVPVMPLQHFAVMTSALAALNVGLLMSLEWTNFTKRP